MRKKRKLVFGVGVNDADYAVTSMVNGVQIACPFYRAWHHMIRRAYSKELHKIRPTYADATVCAEWLSFMNFREWAESQDWRNKALDKDIISPGNREYRPDRCCFVSTAINGLLNNCRKSRGGYPCGVSKDRGKYQSHVRIYGKQKRLAHQN